MTTRSGATIVLPDDIVRTLTRLHDAVPSALVLVGGWAVRCRLQMARSFSRPTEDLDVVLPQSARPAKAALEAIDAVQRDPAHPCRLDGLPVLVDLLADDLPSGVAPAHPGRVDERVTDPDGLNLLVPPFAALLSRTAELTHLTTADGSHTAEVLLPLAGAVVAAKAANVALEFRLPAKRASDGEDTARLLIAFGPLALLDDLGRAGADERADLRHHLSALGGGGISGQARAAGFDHDERRVAEVVDRLVDGLA
jgi:hypothetical protein